MKTRPILFNGQMVAAILDGSKTQTRRPIKHHPIIGYPEDWCGNQDSVVRTCGSVDRHCAIGMVGDRLWVRETHTIVSAYGDDRRGRWSVWAGLPFTISQDGTQAAYYRQGFDRSPPSLWRPSIHMPRWASRITLAIVGVTAERLLSIDDDGARAEGFVDRDAFEDCWRGLYGDVAWDNDPWVWVIGFRRVELT